MLFGQKDKQDLNRGNVSIEIQIRARIEMMIEEEEVLCIVVLVVLCKKDENKGKSSSSAQHIYLPCSNANHHGSSFGNRTYAN